MTAMLTVENLYQTYENHTILADIGFSIVPQTFVAILGPSGSGKTTLMRSILQLLPPQQGNIWLEETNLTQCSPKTLRASRARIATVTQQFSLVRRRSVLENCLGGRLREIPLWRCLAGQYPGYLLEAGLVALEKVELLEYAFQRADRLSGGQKQRVAIARALTQQASLILADEPVSSLDPQTAHNVLALLRSLCQQEGLTVVCNMHQVAYAKQYSDRILGIQNGKLVLDVATSQVSDRDLQVLYNTKSDVHRPRLR